MLSAVVKGFYGSLSCPLQCVSTCEISKHCQKVLGSRVSCCIFSDILDYCPCLPSWQQLRHFTPKDRFKTVMRCFQKKNSPTIVFVTAASAGQNLQALISVARHVSHGQLSARRVGGMMPDDCWYLIGRLW